MSLLKKVAYVKEVSAKVFCRDCLAPVTIPSQAHFFEASLQGASSLQRQHEAACGADTGADAPPHPIDCLRVMIAEWKASATALQGCWAAEVCGCGGRGVREARLCSFAVSMGAAVGRLLRLCRVRLRLRYRCACGCACGCGIAFVLPVCYWSATGLTLVKSPKCRGCRSS